MFNVYPVITYSTIINRIKKNMAEKVNLVQMETGDRKKYIVITADYFD